ncbi:MAG: DNA ligase [Chromatiales bacterium]|nr:DNA ligase [Chromatiales bacterium]
MEARYHPPSIYWLALQIFSFAYPSWASPPVQLAGIYQDSIDVHSYWVSEKLDGVRAYWDGKQLLSRQGNPFPAPGWFTAPLPQRPLDGELWIARGQFEVVSGIVRTQQPADTDWQKVRYMVFDLPASPQPFTQRLAQLRRLIPNLNTPWIRLVKQFQVDTQKTLMAELNRIVAAGGEGLMLHHGDAYYRSGRSNHLLKLKPHQDAEAKVIAHLPGRGKFEGMLGSLLVETDEGIRFRVGTGFSDEQRRKPPPIGATITYRYHGHTKNGIPRFASFLRIRENI